ncbi:ATP-binding protein [Anaerolineales bacterium HSG24]|nr:ATP-binding protein [Anaerolineales bacterium HSG24]
MNKANGFGESEDLIWGDMDDLLDQGDSLDLVDDSLSVEVDPDEYWKVLIVDDEVEIHEATRIALDNLQVDQKGLAFISAYSGREAQNLMREHDDTALILLDVIMEQPDTGLQVAQYVREELGNKQVRIVLRTGHPGETPEETVILNYEINDYKTKTELTRNKLFTTVVAALRSYRDIKTIQSNQQVLGKLNRKLEEANSMLEKRVQARTQRLEIIAMLGEQLNALLDVDHVLKTLVYQVQKQFGYYYVQVYLLDEQGEQLIMTEGTGKVGALKLHGHQIPLLAERSLVAQAACTGQIVWIDDVSSASNWLPNSLLPDTQAEIDVPIVEGESVVGVLNVQHDEPLDWNEADMNLFRFLATQVAVALKNARLYGLAQQANKKLEKLNNDKDKFFSIVAHDLKGPFQPLLGDSQLLVDKTGIYPTSEIKEIGVRLNHAAKQTYSLLENLLEWARMQMGRMPYNPNYVSLNQLFEKNIKMLASTAHNKQITIESQLHASIVVQADEWMLNTIIRNLISNALKFTPSGGRVTLSVHPSAEPDMVEVWMQDTGIGINEANIVKLFKVGEHHTSIGTAQESGTGLGLIMCQEMVSKHGGQIWVESEVGVGTTFKFTMPAVAPLPSGEWLSESAVIAPSIETDLSEEQLLKRLQNCSPSLIIGLEVAALDGGFTKLLELAEQITQHDVILGKHLIKLIERFDYDDILELVSKTKLILPPMEQLTELHHLAKRGSIRKMNKWAERVAQMDEAYRPFVEQVLALVKQFDNQGIEKFVKQYLI